MHDAQHPATGDRGAPDGGDDGGDGGKGWKIAAALAVVAALVALGALGSLLIGGGGGGGDKPAGDVRACIPKRDFRKDAKDDGGAECPPKGAKQLDGLVQKTTGGGFTMQVIEGGETGKTVKLHVREPDKPYIDIAHAQTHAALGQPIRVYIEPIDGKDSVIYMEDAPLLR
jgi:hypothetical protein